MTYEEKLKILEEYDSPELETFTSKILVTKKKHSKLLDQDLTIQVNNKSSKEFEFSRPIYVDNIEFHASKEDGSIVLNMEVEYIDGTKEEFSDFTPIDNDTESKVYVHIQGFVKSFNIRSIKWKGLRTCKIKRVAIEGYDLEKFRDLSHEFSDFIENYDDLKKEIHEKKEKLESSRSKLSEERQNFESIKPGLNEEIKVLRESKSQVEEEVKAITKKKEELESTEAKLKAAVDQLQSKETTIESNINKLTGERDDLNKEISSKEDKLSKLKQNESLFTESLQGLGEEGKKHIALYSRIAVVLFLIIFVIGLFLTLQLNELINLYLESKRSNLNVSAWDFFLMRAPYSPILLSIIAGIFAMIVKLINSILEIQTQRRSIISLSILASEINHSSADGLEISDDEKYQLKEELKFDLLSTSWMKDIFVGLKNKRERLRGKLKEQKALLDSEETQSSSTT